MQFTPFTPDQTKPGLFSTSAKAFNMEAIPSAPLNQNAPIFTLAAPSFTPDSCKKTNYMQAEPISQAEQLDDDAVSSVQEKKKKKTRRGKGGGCLAIERAQTLLQERQELKNQQIKESQQQRERKKGSKGLTPNEIVNEYGLDHTKYKTEICKNWIESGICRYGTKCQFAHGTEDVSVPPSQPLNEFIFQGVSSKYKSKICQSFFQQNYCAYGSRCLFRHEERSMVEVHQRTYAAHLCQIVAQAKLLDDDFEEEPMSERLPVFSHIQLHDQWSKVEQISASESLQDTSSTECSVDETTLQTVDLIQEDNNSSENSANLFGEDFQAVNQCLWLLNDELDLQDESLFIL